MDKKILFLIAALLIVGAGCAPEQPRETGTTTEQITETGQAEQQAETEETLSQKEQLLLDFIGRTNRIESYSYNDFDSKTSYHVKGTKIKIELFDKVGVAASDQYDTVYLNKADRTAFGVCAVRTRCAFSQRQNYRSVSFSQYNPKTPLEIVQELKSKNAEVREFETRVVESAPTIAVTYTDEMENEVKLWLNEYYAFPHEIEKIKDEVIISKTRFTDAAFNKLSESDVTLPEGLTLVE